MDYLIFGFSLIAAVPAYTYGICLYKNGNKAGAVCTWVMVLLGVGLSAFSVLRY